MKQTNLVFTVVCLSLIALASQAVIVNGQFFDQLMTNINNANKDASGQQVDVASRFSSMFKDMMSVNVPVFYDMVKNGSSMGINVLSGLVKVERGEEAEKSGLQGRRPLSVRVFGVPVYERGQRVRNASPSINTKPGDGREPKVEGPIDEEELPINP